MICFAWDGFPQYAARCVGAFVRSTTERVVVIATRPAVPVEGMERVCNCPVQWIGENGEGEEGRGARSRSTEEMDVLLVSGWGIPAFNELAAQVRARGGRVICMVDHNLRKNLRTWIKAIWFRFAKKTKFDGFFVPGRAGRRLLRFYGVSDDKIMEGLYAADASIFHDGLPLAKREKKIIYVGQFIERKNVKRLVEAFARSRSRKEVDSGWELHLYGSGPLREELSNFQTFKLSNFHVHDFVQPEQLADLYRSARFFCLPSLEEHWGLVVHEAALSGCGLLLGDRVGAADDLLNKGKNGWAFNPLDVEDMVRVMRNAMEADDVALANIQAESLRMAQNASLEKFVEGVRKLIGK